MDRKGHLFFFAVLVINVYNELIFGQNCEGQGKETGSGTLKISGYFITAFV